MDVLDHIKEEHEKFRKLMASIESAQGDKKKNLFRELYAELNGHHEAEEHVVFPIVQEKVKGKDVGVVLEMIEEHSLGNYQFSLLEKTSVENETWDAKFNVLKEILGHHMEEEENEFMPVARKAVTKEKLTDMLEEFEITLKKYRNEKKQELGV